MSATPNSDPDPDADQTPDPAEVVDGLANYILSVNDEFAGVGGDGDGDGDGVDTKEWQYDEGPRGADRWRNSETGNLTYSRPEGAPPAPDDEEGDDTDSDTGAADELSDVPDAGPSELAGGIAAAIDDGRGDFHDIRNAIAGADTRQEAQAVMTDTLTDEEIADAAAEVARQQEMREEFETVEDVSELRFGQPVLYDATRPKRGVVDDIDADGTVWLNNAHRDAGGGVNPEYGTLYADPEYEGVGEGDDAPFTAEPGRYGLASNPEVLENTFEAADSVTGSREAGVKGGNTTGDKMKIAEMDDGSRVFATPLSAYPGPTGVVRSEAEARRNNLRSPEVIDALGGTAAQTALTDGPGDEAYIAKEGVPGDTVAEYSKRGGSASDAVKESAADTMAAAYFVGNVDLHGGNMVVNYDDAEVAVIDHDSAGKTVDRYAGVERVPDLGRYDNGPPGIPTDAREKIYEKAQDIRAGRVDFGAASQTLHEGFAEDAADKAVRAAYVDPSYDLPDDQVPASLQFPPTLDIETIDDFEDPNDDPAESYPVVYVDGAGNKVTGEVTNVTEDELVIDGPQMDLVDDPNRVVELL